MADVTISSARAVRPAHNAALPVESLSAALNAPTDQWAIANNGSVLLQLVNEHATQVATFTIVTAGLVDGNAIADRVYTVAAGRRSPMLGPWPVKTYGSPIVVTATAQGTKRVATIRFA